MSKRSVVGVCVLAFVLTLAVAQAEALTLCFRDQSSNTFVVDTGVLFSGQFSAAVGAYITSGGTSFPLSGVAYLRSDGQARLGFTVHSSDANNFPLSGQAVLTGPGFNSGTGSTDSLGGGFTVLTLTSTTCPAVTQ